MNIGDLWSWLMGPQTWIGTRFWIIAALVAVPVFIVRQVRADRRRDRMLDERRLALYRRDDQEDDD